MKQDKLWDFYQTEHIDIFEGSFHRLFFLSKKCEGKRVLNIGIGGGGFERLAFKYKIDIYSLDPSEKTVLSLRKELNLSKERIKVGYSNRIPFENNFFDVVVMSEVLEHLEKKEIEETLDEVHRVLKNGGVGIGTVPYEENLNDSIVFCPKCGYKFHRWGHVQSFDEQKLYALLKRRFNIIHIKVKKFSSMDIFSFKGKILAFGGFIKYKILKFAGVKSLGENLYFECVKK